MRQTMETTIKQIAKINAGCILISDNFWIWKSLLKGRALRSNWLLILKCFETIIVFPFYNITGDYRRAFQKFIIDQLGTLGSASHCRVLIKYL